MTPEGAESQKGHRKEAERKEETRGQSGATDHRDGEKERRPRVLHGSALRRKDPKGGGALIKGRGFGKWAGLGSNGAELGFCGAEFGILWGTDWRSMGHNLGSL